MLLYWDLVQIDKMMWVFRKRIAELKEENLQLKNKPEDTERPSKIIQIIHKKNRISLDKPVEEWTPAHFIKYYQQKYREKYNHDCKYSSDDWKGYAVRVHHFLQRQQLTPEQYKAFIDWAFKKVFSRTFIPTFGNIVSDTHFYQWRDSSTKEQRTADDVFKSMAEEQNKDKGTSLENVNKLINGLGI